MIRRALIGIVCAVLAVLVMLYGPHIVAHLIQTIGS